MPKYICYKVVQESKDGFRLASVPTEDIEEVVHCMECVYWQDNNGGYPTEDCKWRSDETPDAYDFCSEGVRK